MKWYQVILIQKNQWKNMFIFTCPICKKIGNYKIIIPMIKAVGFFTAVLISKGDICPHEFLAYIDNNYDIRGYQKIDFSLVDLEKGIEIAPMIWITKYMLFPI